jgi:hypothetical protein
MPTSKLSLDGFQTAEGDPNEKVQEALKKQYGLAIETALTSLSTPWLHANQTSLRQLYDVPNAAPVRLNNITTLSNTLSSISTSHDLMAYIRASQNYPLSGPLWG